jgi:predicted deacylase
VLLVHLANVSGFLGRRIQVNPQDNKNLNRAFPGWPDGTITERLAWALSTDIIARCTHVLDVHAGEANEDLRPYAGYYEYAGPLGPGPANGRGLRLPLSGAVRQRAQPARGLAVLLARGHAARHPGRRYWVRPPLGQAETDNVLLIKQALGRLLVHLGLLPGTLPPATPTFIAQRTTVNSPRTGFFYPLVKAGEFIAQGRLGYVTDLFGEPVADITAPVTGIVLYMSATPPITKGESLFSIGHLPAGALSR